MEKSDKQLIILTVPHSRCLKDVNKSQHTCDYVALKSANQISMKVENGIRKVVVLAADINRTVTDLNRIESSDSKYHTLLKEIVDVKITEILKNNVVNDNNIIYIIDCHSFPGYSFPNISITDPDVCILIANCLQLIYVEELTDTFKKYGIQVTTHPGAGNFIIEKYFSYDNHLLETGYSIKIIPILIEFNENLNYKKLLVICDCIEQWINKVNDYMVKQLKDK